MAGQHVFGFKHAAGASAKVHDGLDAVANPRPTYADAEAVAALAFATPLPANADRVRNVVGQMEQFERGDEEGAELVPGAGLGASAGHPVVGVAGHDVKRSHELGAEGVKDHDGFKDSEKAEGEKIAEGAKEVEAAHGSVVDHFEREATEGAAFVPGADVGASGVHPLGGGAGHDADRSHELDAEGVKKHDGFKASEKVEGEKIAEGAKEVETADESVVDQFEREAAEGAASVPGAGLGASGVHSLGGGAGQEAEHSDEIGAEGAKIQDHHGFKSSEEKMGEGNTAAEGAKKETAADALGTGVHLDGIGGPMGSVSNSKTDEPELSDKSAAESEEDEEHTGEESDENDAEREDGEDGGCVRAAAQCALGLVGLGVGAALVAYTAARAHYGGALQRDCLMLDDASTRAIPDAHPYCLFDGSNVPTESVSLPLLELESGSLESQSEIGFEVPEENKWDWVLNDTETEIDITTESLSNTTQESPSNNKVYADYAMGWERFLPRGGTATAVGSTPGLFDGSNVPTESVSLPFQELESGNLESQSEIGFGVPEENKWAWVLNDTDKAEIDITPESLPNSQEPPSNNGVYADYAMGWERSIPRGGTATAVASTPVEDLAYRRITNAAFLVATIILFLALVIPCMLMYM